MPEFNCQVDAKEFKEALIRIRKIIGKKPRLDLVLDFSEQDLVINCGGTEVLVGKKGTSRGKAKLSGHCANGLSMLQSKAATLSVQAMEDCIKIETMTLPCVWYDISPEFVSLPIGADFLTILSLRFDHTEAELEASGLEKILAQAESRLDRLMTNALKHLEPIGVTKEELQAWVGEKIRVKKNRRI